MIQKRAEPRSGNYGGSKALMSSRHGSILPETAQERLGCFAIALVGVTLLFAAFWVMGIAAVVV